MCILAAGLAGCGTSVYGILRTEQTDWNSLKSCLHDERPWVREYAAVRTGQLKCRRAVPDLCRLLEDRQPWVRQAAATALARIRDPAALDDLTRRLADEPDVDVQCAILYAVGSIGEAGAMDPDQKRRTLTVVETKRENSSLLIRGAAEYAYERINR